MWKVYGLVDPRDGRIRYVGCSRQKYLSNRLTVHIGAARHSHLRGHNCKRSEWIREVLAAGERPAIQLLQVAYTEQAAAEAERNWIAQLGAEVVNQSTGGPGLPNPSPEIRAKLSAAQKRIWAERSPEERDVFKQRLRAAAWTPEANARRAESNRGRKISEETRQKLIASHKGKKASAETRAKMSASQKARHKK